jgi:hypothetical protein
MLKRIPRRRLSNGRRVVIIGVVGATAAAVALLGASTASAVLSGSPSNFEANDGNMVVDTSGNNDWASVDFFHVADISNSTADDSFTPGQKQDSTCPDISGHKNSQKDDFTDVASYSETNSTSQETYLYGATIRYAANGNASENVELKQGTNGLCANSTTLLARTPGDKLIAIDYLGGGTSVQFNVLTWVDTGGCFVPKDPAPCWGATVLSLSTAGAEGHASQSAIAAGDNPISNTALVAGQFAEFGVNLATAGIIPAGSCQAFPQTVWESRASGSSFVSSTKDVAIENHTITNCGEVKIIKHTDPRGVNQAFSFTSTLTGDEVTCTQDTDPGDSKASFSLNDNGNTTADSAANTQDCTNVPAGDYTVTEGTEPSGFVLESLSCVADGDGASGEQDGTVDEQANITVTANSTVTCTYVNQQQRGAIKITKTDSKTTHGLSGATFSITGPNSYSNSVQTGGTTGTVCVGNLPFGTYTVTETAAPTGYAIDDATGHSVTVDNNASCSDTTYVGEAISFSDTPLADIQVRFRDGGSGTTSATISCDNATGSTSTTGTTGWDTTKTVTGIKAPTVIHCTINIDP